jgi:hypothetical protein
MTKQITAKKIAQLRAMADRLEEQSADKFRDRPTHTARMLKHARSAEREGAQMRRAAQFIRAYCDAAEAGTLPAVLAEARPPAKAGFLEIAARKSRHVSNGYHGYLVDTDEWVNEHKIAVAIRELAEAGMSDEDRQAEADQAKQLEIKRMIDELRNCDIEGFFPTPPAVIDRMLEAADMEDGTTVLEPSAGLGDIVDRVKAEYPHAEIDAVEIRPSLQKILKAKGHGTVGGDFLEFNGNGRQYDRVLMNPPFEGGADMVHVRHAFNLVKPGGRLVAIMSAGAFFRMGNRAKGFRSWLGEFDPQVTDLPDDAFQTDAFRKTGVQTKLVVIDKPGVTNEPQPKGEKPEAKPKVEKVKRERGASGAPGGTQAGRKPARGGNLLDRYAPKTIADIKGQQHVVRSLQSFVADPYSAAFLFAGGSGVGKTAAAHALAHDLGCDPDWGGIVEIPSGKQDGRAVEELYRRIHLRPLGGSGWTVVIVNEADCMTKQAEAIWLDVLEKLPPKVVIVFTTNLLPALSNRFRRRCEVHEFASDTVPFREAMERVVRHVWSDLTGEQLGDLPEGLGQFELAEPGYSIGLALQQIAPFIRTGDQLPESFAVPIVRETCGVK